MNKTIRLYTNTGLGNQIQFIPALKVLKKANFQIYTDSPLYLELLPDHVYKPGTITGKQKFNIGILLYHIGLPIAWRAKRECHKLIGFPYSFKITGHRKIPVISTLFLENHINFNEDQSEIENNIRLLEYFEINNPEIDFSVDIKRNPEKDAIGISAGSGAHPEKRWQHFPELFNSMPEKNFRLFGNEFKLNQDLYSKSNHKNVKIMSTKTLIDASLEIAKCEIFIANDNGLMHLADLLKVPTIAIFGMTNINRNRPWNKPNELISLNLSCAPCYRNGNIHCTHVEKYACMKISVNNITDAVSRLENRI